MIEGRQGKPKRKLLFCNPQVTVLMWKAETLDDEETKDVRFINISDIKSIRLGKDIDPTTSDAVLEAAVGAGQITQSEVYAVRDARKKEGYDEKHPHKQSSNFFAGFFGSKEKDTVLFGTSILRRSCKPDEMKMCISFSLEDRTCDIQCLNQKDLDTLKINLNELIHAGAAKTLHEKVSSMYLAANDNPLQQIKANKKKNAPKKSVRFSADENDSTSIPAEDLASKSISRNGSEIMYLNEDAENLDVLVSQSKKILKQT